MAVTVVSSKMKGHALGHAEAEIELSGLTAGETETVNFPSQGPGVGTPLVSLSLKRIKTKATSGSPCHLDTWASTETAGTYGQFTCQFGTETGGDLTGAVVILELKWLDHARQDGQSINSDNDT